jgi:hypothetical protein
MKQIGECQYSAFISYANADNKGWFGWVADFKHALEKNLEVRARNKIPGIFFSKHDPATAGRLSDNLKEKIASSFAMIVVISDGYVKSQYCMDELEYFREIFGEDGFRERLYLVVMEASAIKSLKQSAAWRRLFPNEDQVWLPFYQDDDPDEPTIPWGSSNREGALLSAFYERLKPLVKGFGEKLRQSAMDVDSIGAARTRYVGTQSAASSKTQIGVTTPDLADAVASLRSEMQRTGTTTGEIEKDALLDGFGDFDGATRLVLPFNNAQPLAPYLPGGHLALQRDAWLELGHRPESLIWLDMRDIAAGRPAEKPHTDFVASIASRSVRREALLPKLPAGAQTQGRMEIRIFIESNQHEHERHLWQPLGDKIKKRYERLVAGRRMAPPIRVSPRGFPVDSWDTCLDEADGILLLWGEKDLRALNPQINKVEGQFEKDYPPCVVAHLAPPQPYQPNPMPSYLWQVLRFQGEKPEEVDVVPGDDQDYDRFLLDILECRSKKNAANSQDVQ